MTASSPGASPPFRVLCVDDYPGVADSTVRLLRSVGFEALACYDGLSALAVAETFCPSVCIIDLNMPGMDGDEVALRLAQRSEKKPLLVAATAQCDEQSRERIRRAGFDLHLVKPVDPQNLIGVVDALFQRAELNAKGKVAGESAGHH